MKIKTLTVLVGALCMGALIMGCLPVVGPSVAELTPVSRAMGEGGNGGGAGGAGPGNGNGGGNGGGESDVAGNNLSFPVIWADDPMGSFATVDNGARSAAVYTLDGAWWYWVGFDGDVPIVVDPDSGPTVDPSWVKAFEQQDEGNTWTADAVGWGEYLGETSPSALNVSLIDWGDNLESVDWTTRSKVRTEVVLYKDLPDTGASLYGYDMRHIRDLGIDEMHGLKVELDEPTTPDPLTGTIAVEPIEVRQPIVYTNHARLTIQKLKVSRDDERVIAGSPTYALAWDEDAHRWKDTADQSVQDLIDEQTIFNEAVYEDTADGPGGYSAEVNVKGRIVYGYTWDTRKDDLAEGDYRITFSLDSGSNANLIGAAILTPLEETLSVAAEEEEGDTGGDTGGGSPVVSDSHNLTYIDIHLRSGGGGN